MILTKKDDMQTTLVWVKNEEKQWRLHYEEHEREKNWVNIRDNDAHYLQGLIKGKYHYEV